MIINFDQFKSAFGNAPRRPGGNNPFAGSWKRADGGPWSEPDPEREVRRPSASPKKSMVTIILITAVVAFLMFYNTQLLDELDGDQDRMHYYKPAKISELFEADKAALLPLPSVFFDTSRLVTGLKTDGYGRFTLDNGKHEYSSAPKYSVKVIIGKILSVL